MAELDAYVIKFTKKNNTSKVAGTGFLVSDTHVVTCTHVLWTVLGQNKSNFTNCIKEGEQFEAELPFRIPPQIIQLRVIQSNGWNPDADTASLDDISILKIQEDEFQSDPPSIKTPEPESCREHDFFAKGFHDPKGDEIKGTSASIISNGRVQLNIDSTYTNLGGASGAPVWDKALQAITGMLQSDKDSESKAYMIPMQKIQLFCAELHVFPKQSNNQNTAELIPDKILGDEFKVFVHEKISEALSHSKAQYLKQQLASLLGCDNNANDCITLICDKLLEYPADECINHYLKFATTDCVCDDGILYAEAGEQKDEIKIISRQILGWLVLSCVDEAHLTKIMPDCSDHQSLFFSLDVFSLAGVEVVLSRLFHHQAEWRAEESTNQQSPHYLTAQKSWYKWDEGETLRKILIEIWNQVFKGVDDQKAAEEELVPFEIKQLDATLKSRRNNPRNTEHYYIAFEKLIDNSEFSKKIYQNLLSQLKQMTVVEYAGTESKNLFLLPEEDIVTAINEYFRAINS